MNEDSTSPQRIQRRRVKGWRMPPNTIYCGRPSLYANPFPVGELVAEYTRPRSIELFREWIDGYITVEMWPWGHAAMKNFHNRVEGAISPLEWGRMNLAGKNLACWCRLDEECHCDVWLEVANEARG